MTAEFFVVPRAVADLDWQANYLAREATEETAERFLQQARGTFQLLATQPELGWPARLKHPQLKDLRIFRVRRFEHVLILYRPLPEGVLILRVMHGSRNLAKLLRQREEISEL